MPKVRDSATTATASVPGNAGTVPETLQKRQTPRLGPHSAFVHIRRCEKRPCALHRMTGRADIRNREAGKATCEDPVTESPRDRVRRILPDRRWRRGLHKRRRYGTMLRDAERFPKFFSKGRLFRY